MSDNVVSNLIQLARFGVLIFVSYTNAIIIRIETRNEKERVDS